MVLSSLVAGLLLAAPAKDYVAPSAPASRLVPEIGRVYGEDWRAPNPIGLNVLHVNVRSVTAEALRSRLAELLHATWTEKDGVWTLSRPEEQEEALRQRLAARHSAILREELERAATRVDPAPTVDSYRQIARQLLTLRERDQDYSFRPYSELTGPIEATPGRRAAIRLLRDLPPADLAPLRQWSRRVYALNPNRRQLPLGPNAKKILDDLDRDAKNWAAAVEAINPPKPQLMYEGDPLLDPTRVQGAREALLVLKQTNTGATLLADLVLPSGRVLGQLWMGSPQQREAHGALFRKPPADEPEIVLPEDSVLLRDAIRSSFTGPMAGHTLAAPPAAALRKFAEVGRIEPVSVSMDPGLRAWAAESPTNLIAWIPDAYAVMPAMLAEAAGTRLTVSSMLNLMARVSEMEIRSEDGWTTVRPVDPTRWEYAPIDRGRLQSLLVTARDRQHVDLVTRARFHYSIGSPPGSILELLAAIWDPNYFVGNVMGNRALAFLGSLSDAQIASLRAGAPLMATQLTVDQRRAAEAWLYSDRMSVDGTIRTIEPTVVAPNGLPSDFAVGLQIFSQPAVFRAEGLPRLMRAHEIAAEDRARKGLYRLGRMDRWTLTLLLRNPEGRLTESYEEFTVGSEPPVPYAQLPDRVRQEVESYPPPSELFDTSTSAVSPN